ncbi:predicted protein [Histoplasma mississippiense (nom. inval.)]|uniref:predicted protein n=1 Tax=Ajellomyces capsulatus (strain NAm1 / WU24) TaxID=2059318 RepID=UPI000157B6E2|nr:predicted protein [Histoplasma mississippiense (nom. inval.)]EDN02697.1 predicted protein [Histoplasma mississippiense (nom. inval.)]
MLRLFGGSGPAAAEQSAAISLVRTQRGQELDTRLRRAIMDCVCVQSRRELEQEVAETKTTVFY